MPHASTMVNTGRVISPDDPTAPVSTEQFRECAFLCEYASYMLGCGATCSRITKNINRMVEVSGYTMELTILPTHVIVLLRDKDGRGCSLSRRLHVMPIDFTLNTVLSRLSWKVAQGHTSILQARDDFQRIIHTSHYKTWIILLAVSVANASVCRLFGGDFPAMAIVWLASLVGLLLKTLLSKLKIDVKVIALICAFVSAIFGSLGFKTGFTETPDVALATCVLYLIPGIPYINSVTDLLTDHYLCSFRRFMFALVMTVSIAIGLTGAFLLMNLSIF